MLGERICVGAGMARSRKGKSMGLKWQCKAVFLPLASMDSRLVRPLLNGQRLGNLQEGAQL